MKDEFLKLHCVFAELGMYHFFFMEYESNFPNIDLIIIFFVIFIAFFSNLRMRNLTKLIINNIRLSQFNGMFTHLWGLFNKSVIRPMLSLVAWDDKPQ